MLRHDVASSNSLFFAYILFLSVHRRVKCVYVIGVSIRRLWLCVCVCMFWFGLVAQLTDISGSHKIPQNTHCNFILQTFSARPEYSWWTICTIIYEHVCIYNMRRTTRRMVRSRAIVIVSDDDETFPILPRRWTAMLPGIYEIFRLESNAHSASFILHT